MREWRTMHRERAEWEVYRSRLAADAKKVLKPKAELADKQAQFEDENKNEKWGILGLKKNCRLLKTRLLKSVDNGVRRNEDLIKSKADFDERYEAAKVHRERAEQNQEELRQQLIPKDKDMVGKDAEIAEFLRRLHESTEKVDSLEIDFQAENKKAENAIEACKFCQAALDVAQDNYPEVQSVVVPLVNNSEWLQQYRIANVANAVLNFVELDKTVAALTIAARRMGHREWYI
ncbi:hypothetical protein Hanom_Chr06g00508571 [Helianthus anomalus]